MLLARGFLVAFFGLFLGAHAMAQMDGLADGQATLSVKGFSPSDRFGVGYSFPFFDTKGAGPASLPALSVRYWPSSRVGFGGALGVDSQKNAFAFGAMLRGFLGIFNDPNLKVYLGGGLGLSRYQRLIEATNNDDDNNNNDTPAAATSSMRYGFEVNATLGAEFFLPGIDNLGFNFETGVGFVAYGKRLHLHTLALSPFHAGVFFYF